MLTDFLPHFNNTKFLFTLNQYNMYELKNTPNKFYHSKNYMHPCNPSAIIEYSRHKTNNVQITIYYASGRQVAIIVSGTKQTGVNTVKFITAYHTISTNLPSNIYYFKLAAGLPSSVKKLVPLK